MFKYKKTLFYSKGGWTLDQVAPRVCGVFILEDIQNPSGCSHKQPAVAGTVLSGRFGVDHLQMSLPNSTILKYSPYSHKVLILFSFCTPSSYTILRHFISRAFVCTSHVVLISIWFWTSLFFCHTLYLKNSLPSDFLLHLLMLLNKKKYISYIFLIKFSGASWTVYILLL